MQRDLITPVLQAVLVMLLPALLLADDNETSIVWLDGTLLGEAMTGEAASFKSYAQAEICNEGTGMAVVVAEQEAAEIMDSLLENADPATKAQWEEEFAKSADSLMQEIATIGGGQEFYAVGNPEEYTEQLELIFRSLGGERPVALIE